MYLPPLIVQMVEALQDVPGETSNHEFGDQGPGASFLGGLALALDGDHGVDRAAVHVLHYEVDFAFVEEAAVISYLEQIRSGWLLKQGRRIKSYRIRCKTSGACLYQRD